MNRYSYDGPVLSFKKCVTNRWCANTCAVSESKARNNLTHQYKEQFALEANAKITLPGKILLIEQDIKGGKQR